jgi:hypothetical protein
MINFKGNQFEREIILWGVRWYVAYPISYRQLEEIDDPNNSGTPKEGVGSADEPRTPQLLSSRESAGALGLDCGGVTVDEGIAPPVSASKPCVPVTRHTAPQ